MTQTIDDYYRWVQDAYLWGGGLYLIDVSEWNGPIDFRAVYRSGVRGVWAKATEGIGYTDVGFAERYAAARHAGLRVGAYHFARPDLNDPGTEAAHFCGVVGRPQRRDLRPVLDFEKQTTLHPVELESWAHRFCQSVYHRVGVLPIFYSYTAYIEAMHPAKTIGAGLWLANYDGILHVSAPRPWKKFVAHQYTDQAFVPGVSGKCDKSWAPRLWPLLAHPIVGRL